MTDDRDLVGSVCWRPACHKTAVVPLGTPTPIYCSSECEEAVDGEYEAAQERVEYLQDLLARSRYWLAAFDRGDDAPTSGANQAAREALALAKGTLHAMEVTGGPQTDRERYVIEALTALVEAVTPLVEDATRLPSALSESTEKGT